MSLSDFLMEISGLVLLGSWTLALPSALPTIAVVLFLGRKGQVRKRAAALWALGFSTIVAAGMMTWLWGYRGGFEDPLSLLIIIPGATIIAMFGALPGALIARALQNMNARTRKASPELDLP